MPQIPIPAIPDLPAEDLGNMAFTELFGANWWDVTSRSADIVTGPLIPMLESLNAILAVAVSSFALYHLLIGSVGTAAEGQLGGKLHNFWWPVRVSYGLGMTFPISAAGGLSIFQIIILSLVGWSMTLANNIWDNTIDHLAESNFIMMTASPPAHMQQEAQNIAHLLHTVFVTQAYVQKTDIDENNTNVLLGRGEVDTADFASPFASSSFVAPYSPIGLGLTLSRNGNWVIKFKAPSGVDPNDMGYIEIPGPSENDPLLITKREAIYRMAEIIRPVAYSHALNPDVDHTGWVTRATSVYTSALATFCENYAQHYSDADITREINEFREEAKRYGWFAAGAFQIYLSNLRGKAIDAVTIPIEVTPPDVNGLIGALNDVHYREYGSTLATAETRFTSEPDPMNLTKKIGEGGFLSLEGLKNYFTGQATVAYLLGRFEHEDPSIVLSDYGHLLINTGIGLWCANMGMHVAMGTEDAVKKSVLGSVLSGVASVVTVGVSSGTRGAVRATAEYIGSWVEILIGGLFTAGVVLAYLVPSMPLLYWALAMCGFILLVVEVMVAAPFWAAAHAWSTADEGFAGEMGQRGYIQFLEILFRPPLYVLGFFVVMTTMKVMGKVVAALFQLFYAGYSETVLFMGLITNFMMCLIMGGMFMYMFYFLCSEGYSKLPRRVIRWIGGDGNSMGSASHAEGTRNMIAGGVMNSTTMNEGPSTQGKDANKEGEGGGDGDGSEGGGGGDKSNPHAPGEASERTPGSGVGVKSNNANNLKKISN